MMNIHKLRDSAIKQCLDNSKENLSELRKLKNSDAPDPKVFKDYKRQQTITKMVENELAVEQIIVDRSLKAFRDRCREFINFSN